jgi:hypothetical protein
LRQRPLAGQAKKNEQDQIQGEGPQYRIYDTLLRAGRTG